MYDIQGYNLPGLSPLRAGGNGAYVVQRSSASESPNYFYTTDFKTFNSLSDVHPEKSYNWYTTELITWKTFDGSVDQGVLYKPEDFDPHKKYPLIINYYEKKSANLHKYWNPEPMGSELEIPWFVSHGYLVFTPDIHYKIGHTGASAYNAVVSGAKYLTGFPWVDSAHIGIQGHSFGGFETNYLVAHTHMFAAAMASSGFADIVSGYGALGYGAGSFWSWYLEHSQFRLGATPWQRPDLYLENSPILRADHVTTPLLMMNNKGDTIVPFAQGVEWFSALRRLGKRVWMLQYDGERHSIIDQKAARQHTVRVTQFFDHYLTGAPAPKWMTEGVPARLKGLETGLNLDRPEAEPVAGALLIKPEKQPPRKTDAILTAQTEKDTRTGVRSPTIATKNIGH